MPADWQIEKGDNMMKHAWLMLSLTIVLSACSAQATEPDQNEKKQEQKTETSASSPSNQNATEDSYVPNPQITDDRSLLEPGQTVKDDKGAAELKAISSLNQTYKAGDVELTIKDVKMIEHTPAYSMIDFFHTFTHEETFDIIKAEVEVKNTSDQPVYFSPVAMLETDNGQRIDWESDIYLEDLNGELGANQTKKGNIGFILKHSEEPVKSVTLLTSDVLNAEQKTESKAQKITVPFK
ncbi:DUF4352 domain-containing protein [Metabacillus sp. SLBN-84]